MRATVIYITCILGPADWYTHASGEPVQQVLRRITAQSEVSADDSDQLKAEWAAYRSTREVVPDSQEPAIVLNV